MQQRKPIPIWVEFYKRMISKGYYYIDKTLLVRDLLEQKNTVTLFTRPRRFGRTLAQSMLKTFFEYAGYFGFTQDEVDGFWRLTGLQIEEMK